MASFVEVHITSISVQALDSSEFPKNGSSNETCFIVFHLKNSIFSRGFSIMSVISPSVGSLPNSCSSFSFPLLNLLSSATLLRGSLTILPCSAIACKMVCLIRQTAYEMNLNPLVSSNLFAAFISPRFPSLIRSGSASH